MSKILTKEELSSRLRAYYIEHYGEDADDTVYETSAVNVFTFGRRGRTIILKCHILTGEIEELVQ